MALPTTGRAMISAIFVQSRISSPYPNIKLRSIWAGNELGQSVRSPRLSSPTGFLMRRILSRCERSFLLTEESLAVAAGFRHNQ